MVSYIIMTKIRRISKRSDICFSLPASGNLFATGSSPRSPAALEWPYPSPGDPHGLTKSIIDLVPCDDPVVTFFDERITK